MRRVIVIIAAVLLISVATWYVRRDDGALGRANPAASATSSARARDAAAKSASAEAATVNGNTRRPANGKAGGTAWSPEEFPLAAELNAPGSTIARDLDVIRQILEGWRTNFPHDGNPVGDNSEITAALLGDNRLSLALVPKGHPAVNERGELCDRWGTPFRFHALSGTRMEIRSAGPDRKFGTDDDALWSPQ